MIEVICALAAQDGVDEKALMALVARKRAARGGFTRGCFYSGDEDQSESGESTDPSGTGTKTP